MSRSKESKGSDKPSYYARNKEKVLARSKEYRKNNPEKIREQNKRWVAENKVKDRWQRRQYYIRNREARLLYAKNKREAVKHTPEWRWQKIRLQKRLLNISREAFLEWAANAGNICSYCELTIETAGYGVDRVDSNKPYEEGNIVNCCMRCNQAKNDMSVEDFKEHITRIYETFQRKASQSK